MSSIDKSIDEMFVFIDTVRDYLAKLELEKGLEFGRRGSQKDVDAIVDILGGARLDEFGGVLTMMLGPGDAGVEFLGFDAKLGNKNPAYFKNALDTYPEWYRLNWLPIAADGCGGYYIYPLTCEATNARPVFVVRPSTAPLEPEQYVASNVYRFVMRALEVEVIDLGEYPFSKEYLAKCDPELPIVVQKFEAESLKYSSLIDFN